MTCIWDSLVSIFWAIPLIKCIHMQQKPSDMVYSTADIVHQFLKVVRATRLCGHHQSRKKELKNSHCWFVCCHPTTTGNFQWTWCNAWYKSGSIVAMHRIPCILITKFLLFLAQGLTLAIRNCCCMCLSHKSTIALETVMTLKTGYLPLNEICSWLNVPYSQLTHY